MANFAVMTRVVRFLLLASFVFLQALSPLMHAHAGDLPQHHTEGLHLHVVVDHGDAADIQTAHGHDVEMSIGLLRGRSEPHPAFVAGEWLVLALLRADLPAASAPVSSAPLPDSVSPPSYARPFALAPPRA
ncbi:MAG: hypothetical protein AB1593_04390 [Pseudomonadota bacterium]